MEWITEEKELFQELREMPKVQLSNKARENMKELLKRQAAVDRKRNMMKLATGGVVGVAAAIGLTIGIMNYDQIKSKLDSQIAGTNENPTATTPISNTAPKIFKYNGRNIDMEKVVAELGDREAEFARMLAEWRDKIDQNYQNDESIDLTSYFSLEHGKLVKLFPELSVEVSRVLQQGRAMEKGEPNPLPKFKFDALLYAKYKDSNLIPFLNYMNELAGNAGMHDSRIPKSSIDEEKIKLARDTFDKYAKYFATEGWKNTSINYNQISLVDNGDEIDVKKDKLTRLIENSGLQIDRLISVINTVDGQRRASVTVGIKNGPIDTVEAKEIHAKIKEELAEKNINGLKLTILFNVEANTYSVNVWDFSGNIEVLNYFTGER